MTRTVHRSAVLRSSHRRAPAAERAAPSRRGPASTPGESIARVAGGMTRLALACSSLAVGYSVTAKFAHDERVAAESASLSAVHRALAGELAFLVASHGWPSPRITSTCRERLGWEWLASSGRLIDGAPDNRLLAECARLQREVDEAVALLVREGAERLLALRQILAALGRCAASGRCPNTERYPSSPSRRRP